MATKLRQSLIVAVIGSLRDFDEIGKFSADSFDMCELRLDLLYGKSKNLEALSLGIRSPKIATVRDPEEGGANALPETTRIELFEQWLPYCDLVDVELRNMGRYSGLVERAAAEGKQVIVSFHDFRETPRIERLQEMLDSCGIRENWIFKLATRTPQWEDLETLARFVQRNAGVRIAAMGMGEFGKLSRLVLPRLGSALVYGSIVDTVAPGLWPVTELARLLAEIS